MSCQVPQQPAPFAPLDASQVSMPNPRTVRAQDLTWYNTRGGNIIRSSFDKCSGKINTSMTPWNRPPVPENKPFWSCPVPRFDLYGNLTSNYPAELSRCRGAGSYHNPN